MSGNKDGQSPTPHQMQRPSTIDIEMQRDRALATKNYRGLVALSMYLLVTSDYAIAIGYQLIENGVPPGFVFLGATVVYVGGIWILGGKIL